MNLGTIIHDRRKQLGLTLEDVGNYVGVNKGTVKKWETGYIQNMRRDKISLLSELLHIDPITFISHDQSDLESNAPAVRIPVYGKVAAGIPITAITDYSEDDPDDWEEIPAQMARGGEYIALRIQGDSMEPRIRKGDVVIVRIQEQVESGDVAIVFVNGEDATCKRVRLSDAGLTLISNNPIYEPMFFTPEEVESLPVRFLGKVVELRGKL